MEKKFRCLSGRLTAIAAVLAVCWIIGLCFETVQAAPFRFQRRSRSSHSVQREKEPVSKKVPAKITVKPLEPADFDALCKQIKTDTKKPEQSDLDRCKTRVVQAAKALGKKLQSEKYAELRKELKLDDLLKAAGNDGLNDKAVNDAWVVLNGNAAILVKEAAVLQPLKTELRRYQTVKALMNGDSFEKQLAAVCDNLTKNIDAYKKDSSAAYGTALTGIVTWLNDISVLNPKTERLAGAVLASAPQTNVRLSAGNKFLGVPFKTSRNEEVDVNNNINGTRMVGTGTMKAESSSELVPSKNGGEIAVVVDGELETFTKGQQSVVSLNSRAYGTLRGEKHIQFLPESIQTKPATVTGSLKSELSNVRINAGPIIGGFARNAVSDRKASSEAAASRNARRQFSERIDKQVDERIAEVNKNYQEKIRQPLLQSDFYPRIIDFSSTETALNAAFLAAGSMQPGSPTAAPDVPNKFDVLIQCHQSAVNNVTAFFLSGKTFNEEKVSAELNDSPFTRLADSFKRAEDQKPLTLKFADKTPVDLSFKDNQITAKLRIDSFIQDGAEYPGLDITIKYSVKLEKDAKGTVQVILEQADAPQAFPRGFDPKSGQKISARHQAIRTIVVKRLESALPKRVVTKPQMLQGNWEGQGSLVPAFADVKNGWLSFAWNWIPAEKKK